MVNTNIIMSCLVLSGLEEARLTLLTEKVSYSSSWVSNFKLHFVEIGVDDVTARP